QVWDARRSVELRAVELACLHRSDKEADYLVKLAAQMSESADDVRESTRIDIEFHNAIAHYSGNPLFSVMVSSLTSMMHATNPIVWRIRSSAELQREIVDLHAEIALAIRSQDVGRATAAMSKHFEVATMGFATSGLSYLNT
ncbi:MAG: FCD domain-containing protein, partial [Pseudomonadota bacterium]